jgi:hypothetical protein
MQLMEIVFTSRIVKGAKRAYADLKDCKQTQKALKVMFSSYLTWNLSALAQAIVQDFCS